jgi:hypothetical protein
VPAPGLPIWSGPRCACSSSWSQCCTWRRRTRTPALPARALRSFFACWCSSCGWCSWFLAPSLVQLLCFSDALLVSVWFKAPCASQSSPLRFCLACSGLLRQHAHGTEKEGVAAFASALRAVPAFCPAVSSRENLGKVIVFVSGPVLCGRLLRKGHAAALLPFCMHTRTHALKLQLQQRRDGRREPPHHEGGGRGGGARLQGAAVGGNHAAKGGGRDGRRAPRHWKQGPKRHQPGGPGAGGAVGTGRGARAMSSESQKRWAIVPNRWFENNDSKQVVKAR